MNDHVVNFKRAAPRPRSAQSERRPLLSQRGRRRRRGGGVPLDSVESAVTAAVRMGYKVAAAQIERTARIARRFRDAGDQAAGARRDQGESSERKALDASEQLIFKALMAGLGWLEGVAADNGNPVRRIAAAQFQMLGAMLGLSYTVACRLRLGLPPQDHLPTS